MLVLVVGMDMGVFIPGAVWPTVPTIHRAVQGVDAGVEVLLLRGSLRRAAYIQDFSIVSFPGLAFPQLPGLCLDPDGENSIRCYFDNKLPSFSKHSTSKKVDHMS